ncbi:hypothetical protein SARC_04804 [Sphaeroforma arctica JP610]|uniref:Uncharacterized protein n=1 Tax=Sphaeroforma arctica JP610 TaxID=667725 RepID=A0A0L0G1D4_9EUKA|nr:hypothetical protein SARC_04804 [Sphaeroforma arctica JP610]KNC82910.1 hypothetical protein SARC_04804 [Sphaeroforma arctica JP610]|eukprot:XP_014156812.1 hypothetical protein SARC_04804 [Sphaeroforma arctica JP610]
MKLQSALVFLTALSGPALVCARQDPFASPSPSPVAIAIADIAVSTIVPQATVPEQPDQTARANLDNGLAVGNITFQDTRDGLNVSVVINIVDINSGLYEECMNPDRRSFNLTWAVHNGRPAGGEGMDMACEDGQGTPRIEGVYDETLACGPGTAEQANCEALKRTADQGYNYTCDPELYESDPYACEVGDLNGRYGAIKMGVNVEGITASANYSITDLRGPRANLLFDRSVVFSCNQTRIYCEAIDEVRT